jgi:metallo-beta-lactamase family protein
VLRDAGHILGSASVQIACRDGDDGPAKRIVFSGDLGQDDRPIIEDPEGFAAADVLVLESTYGDREHGKAGDATAALERIVNRTHADGGKLIIPSFAIERAQELLYHFNTLKNEKRIGTLKVFLDSPMAAKATQVFKTNPQVLDDEAVETLREDDDLFDFPGLYVTRSRRQSMAINGLREPAVIIAGSGMCTGGRVVHHLKRYLDEPEHCVLFVGYQAHGTPGRDIQKYGPRGGFVQLGGRRIDIRCRIETLHGMSGHADRNGLRDWLAGFEDRPRRVFLNHGDEEAAAALAGDIRKQLPRAEVAVPAYREVVEL